MLPTPSFLLRLWGCAVAALTLFSCASSGTSSAGGDRAGLQGSVVYTNAAQNLTFGLLSDSMLVEMGVPGDTPDERSLSYSSDPKRSAEYKICSDDIMKGVMQLLDAEGFNRFAVQGPANTDDRSIDGVLQLTVNGKTSHVFNSDHPDTDPVQKTTYRGIVSAFLVVHGEIPQYQNVGGDVEFKKPEPPSRQRGQSTQSSGASMGASSLLPGSIR